MYETAFQLYSIADVKDKTDTILETVGELSYDGVEFAGFAGTIDEVVAALEETGLEAASAHVGIDALENNLDETLETYRALDCEHLVIPWLDPEAFESRDAVESTATRLAEIADELPPGVTLHYHNHDHEFVEIDGYPALEHVIELTEDVRIEPDLGWIGVAGYDPVAFLDRHGDRISHVHVKDYDADAEEPVEGGDGELDTDALAAVARKNNVDWLIYEHEDRQNSYETANIGARYFEQF